jgi:hypothetical protein
MIRMTLEQEPEKPEMAYIRHQIPAAAVKRYRTLVKRAKKLRVNIPKSHIVAFIKWMDEAETELAAIKASQLQTKAALRGMRLIK